MSLNGDRPLHRRVRRVALFRAANRMNAYNTYLLLEQKGSQADKP
jgi:hypothetical protein